MKNPRDLKQPPNRRQLALHEWFQFRCSRHWLGALAGVGTTVGALLALMLRWRRLRLPVGGTLGVALASSTAYVTLVEPRRPVLERVTLRLPNLPASLDGLRIGHLSDFHLGFPFAADNTRWAVAQMEREHPHLIALTGDFVSSERAIAALPDLLRPLTAPLGVYAVAGNHDHFEGIAGVRAALESVGITFLMNESRGLRWNGGELWVVGVDDCWYGKTDLDAALERVPEGAFTLLLAHPPDFADEAATRHIALQLSGHTHGGHLHLPYLGWFCVPFHGIRYISGLEFVQGMQLYVSRGLGGLPLRLNCPPDATLLTLTRG
jgi:hypothetical protein